MGGYDLNGNYYANRRDALNAEEAQCAAIDARIALDEVSKIKQRGPSSGDWQIIYQYLESFDNRLNVIEEKLGIKP